jgi:hypothetical protein
VVFTHILTKCTVQEAKEKKIHVLVHIGIITLCEGKRCLFVKEPLYSCTVPALRETQIPFPLMPTFSTRVRFLKTPVLHERR